MAHTRDGVAPGWPPAEGAYDYINTLNNVELAWEFLRRNVAYQHAFAHAGASLEGPRALPTGHFVWQRIQPSPDAAAWNLRYFRRSQPYGA